MWCKGIWFSYSRPTDYPAQREMFVTKDNQILINEIAPRPHNSGHYTIEGTVTSQYEQYLRAIMNLPLGSSDIVKPSVMINLFGEEGFIYLHCMRSKGYVYIYHCFKLFMCYVLYYFFSFTSFLSFLLFSLFFPFSVLPFLTFFFYCPVFFSFFLILFLSLFFSFYPFLYVPF